MNSDTFIADLHIHSKYSRATARNLDLENIYVWAQLKGITVVGTGDFTHPEWFSQIVEKLEPAEPGLYRLKKDIACHWDEAVPFSCRAPVRFMLSCEISNIYKKNDRSRKNHNLVFFPDVACVSRFNERLASIGNIGSDGRPILGLDARNLLEIVLETSAAGFLVPAHIWTPWFSMLGSKSGFDSIDACFEDLSGHIFAAETGLSSDPAMNWRVSALDNITLISNSDAHSPAKLGREANLFKTEMNFYAIRAALEKGYKNEFLGTFEFYPEEGKYHVDGHRKCGVCFTPAQTQVHAGICPVCGKPLTLGVLHRVEDLATRPEGFRPARAFPFHRLIPLDELLSEILRVGPQSKKVRQTYQTLLEKMGSEFNILHYLDGGKIASAGMPLLAEAIIRMRENRVSFSPGYDGTFGKCQIFTERERDHLLGRQSLFAAFEKRVESTGAGRPSTDARGGVDNKRVSVNAGPVKPIEATISLNAEQQAAVDYSHGHLMIVAGPGTGKTRTLTHKIAHLLESGVDAQRMLAVTFTNKAAGDMKERLQMLLKKSCPIPFVGTFHALGHQILSTWMSTIPLCVVDEQTRKALLRDVIAINGLTKKKNSIRVDDLMGLIVSAKQRMLSSKDSLDGLCPPERLMEFVSCYRTYEALMELQHLADFEDLIFRPVRLLEKESMLGDRYIGRFSHIFIDEYQDINAGQYRFVKMLAGNNANLCIIGDPDQSIYGFRGSDVSCFNWYRDDFPVSRTIFLRRNYRSTQTILDISTQIIQHNPELPKTGQRRAVYSDLIGERTIHIVETATENAEAVAIGKTIEQMVGGTGFFSLDSGALDGIDDQHSLSFDDFAVLVRIRSQVNSIFRILEKAGIPCQVVDRKTVLDQPGIKNVLAVFKLIQGVGIFSDLQAAIEVFKPASIKTVEILKSWAYQNKMSLAEALVQARRLPFPNMALSRQRQLFEFIVRLDELKEKTVGLPIAGILDLILAETEIKQRYEGDLEFENGCRRLREISTSDTIDPGGFLAAVALSRDTDTYDHRVEKVSLITMHAAKGLEFPVVFIAGCEDEYIPYRTTKRAANVEEERRLFYVALTRAKQHLFLTKANIRRVNGRKVKRQLSPFVKDIENRYKNFSEQSGKKSATSAQQQLSLFE